MGFTHNIKSPCLNCENRNATCHSSCKMYNDFRVRCAEAKKARRKIEDERIAVNDVFSKATWARRYTTWR